MLCLGTERQDCTVSVWGEGSDPVQPVTELFLRGWECPWVSLDFAAAVCLAPHKAGMYFGEKTSVSLSLTSVSFSSHLLSRYY